MLDPLLVSLVPKRPLLDVGQAAHRLFVTQRVVWDLIADGELVAIRIRNRWRIEPADLEAYIETERAKSIARKDREPLPRVVRRRDGPRHESLIHPVAQAANR